MKKRFALLAGIAALSVSGFALADAECQAGSAWGYKEGCGGPTVGNVPVPTVQYGSAYAPPSAQPDPRDYPAASYPYYAYGRRFHPHNGYASRATRNDRDGDGVVNWRDRFPDDPTRQ